MRDAWAEFRHLMPARSRFAPIVAPPPAAPLTMSQRTANPLRPATLDTLVGQTRMKSYLRRVIDAALMRDEPLDHLLLVGGSGVGKSTIANIVANELAVDVYQVEAPVSLDALLELCDVLRDGDVLFIDEIHQQALAERRGRTADAQPEVLYSVMEDRTIVTGLGVEPYPRITVIGATTDEGALPDPFVNRFPLRPQFDPYEIRELVQIARLNGRALKRHVDTDAGLIFAHASRGVPRQINNYVRNAASLAAGDIDAALAREVLELNRVTHDGLTLDMQRTLTFLFTKGERVSKTGDVTYQASVATIATAIGKSRDSKAVVLRVEPYLIEQGYLQVGHGGRVLTPSGIKRAKELLK